MQDSVQKMYLISKYSFQCYLAISWKHVCFQKVMERYVYKVTYWKCSKHAYSVGTYVFGKVFIAKHCFCSVGPVNILRSENKSYNLEELLT